MTMPEHPPIPPALTPKEWADMARHGGPTSSRIFERSEPDEVADDAHSFMATANAALPDGDRRKITRAMVDAVEQSLWAQYGNGFTVDCLSYCRTCRRELPAGSMAFCDEHHADMLRALVAALAAMLPPYPPPYREAP